METKNTRLTKNHLELNARMVTFSGWNMPVQYSEGIIAEHNHTRNKVSIFDICHMGELRITGDGAADAMELIFPRSVTSQKVGTCRYNFLLTDTGTVLDDLIIYRMDNDDFLVVVNAGTKDGDILRLRELLPEHIKMSDDSDSTAKIDLQGPKSGETLVNMGFTKEELPGYYKWINTKIAGESVLLSRTGYTGEIGFELYCNAEHAEKIWNYLLEQPNVKPAGLGARDTLRLEMGYPLYGHEMNTETTPIEAGFGGMLKLDNNRQFPGCKQLRNGAPTKQLLGIITEGRRAAREGAEITIDEKHAGIVTSGAFSPSLGVAIAMGSFDPSLSLSPGKKVKLSVGRSTINGTITAMPFYEKGSVRISI